MSRKRLWRVFSLALLMLAVGLSGWAGGQEEQKLTIWSWMNPAGQTPRELAFKQILTNFSAENPSIKVEVEPVPWQEIQTKWRAAAEIGNAPDVVWLLKAVPDRANYLLDLDANVLNTMSREEIEDLYVMNTIESRIGTGTNYVFPLWQTPGSIVYYRKDMFRRAGLSAPIRTWQEFVASAGKLTMDLNGDGRADIWGYGDSFGERSALASSFTYSLADLQPGFFDLNTKKALFDTDAAVRAASVPVGIAKLGATPADAISNDLETMLQQFAQGRFAMIQAPAHRYGSVRNTLGFDKEEMGIMAWPTWDGQGMGPAFLGYFWEVGISRNAPNKDAAAKFMRHLMNEESSTLWMTMGQQVPNRKSLLDHPFISRPENEVLALSLRIITNKAVFAEPPGINTKEVPSAIGDAIMEMMRKGQVDPALLVRATEKINASQAR